MQNDYKILYDNLQVYQDREAFSLNHIIEVNLFFIKLKNQIVNWKRKKTSAKKD